MSLTKYMEIPFRWKKDLELPWEQNLLGKTKTCCLITEKSCSKFRFSQGKSCKYLVMSTIQQQFGFHVDILLSDYYVKILRIKVCANFHVK